MSDIKSMDISHSSTLGNFTEEEVKLAQKKASACIVAIKKVGIEIFKAMELLYDFEQGRYYMTMRFKSIKQWLESEGIAPSTCSKYLSVFKTLTINNAITVETYENLDRNKIMSIKALADNGAERDELLDAISEADELIITDLIDVTNDKIRRLKSGKSINEKEGEIKSLLEKFEPGAYKLTKITKEDYGQDPRFNKKNMVQVNRVAVRWYYSVDADSFTAVIR